MGTTFPTRDVVVGGASGMGLATATLLSKSHPVVIADRDLERAQAVAEDLTTIGSDVTAIHCDVTDVDSVTSLAQEVSKGCQLRALVISAGLSSGQASGDRVMEVNLVGTASVLESFGPMINDQTVAVGFGSIAAYRASILPGLLDVIDNPLEPALVGRLDGIGADVVNDARAAYRWSKLGVVRLCRRLAPTWGKSGARVLSISPGIVDTPMSKFEADKRPELVAESLRAPLRRRGHPEEIAAVVEFLCSNKASFVTGVDLIIDGGLLAIDAT
jgi:NAD(P)-dependent dehydrogenase (short-subunit alcohol dehydrogenase family)